MISLIISHETERDERISRPMWQLFFFLLKNTASDLDGKDLWYLPDQVQAINTYIEMDKISLDWICADAEPNEKNSTGHK